MKPKYDGDQGKRGDELRFFSLDRLILETTNAVIIAITRFLTMAITFAAAVVVVIGGLWLAHAYLPSTVFRVIFAVVLADVLVGITLRFFLSRRFSSKGVEGQRVRLGRSGR